MIPGFWLCIGRRSAGTAYTAQVYSYRFSSNSQAFFNTPPPYLPTSTCIRSIPIPKLLLRHRIPLSTPLPLAPQRSRIRIHIPDPVIHPIIIIIIAFHSRTPALPAHHTQAHKPPFPRTLPLHMHIEPQRHQRSHQAEQRKAEKRFIRPTHALSQVRLPVLDCACAGKRGSRPPSEQRERHGPKHAQRAVEYEIQGRVQAVPDV